MKQRELLRHLRQFGCYLKRQGKEHDEMPPDPDVEEAWAEVAERRWREIESGNAQTIPWEEVRAKLYRRG